MAQFNGPLKVGITVLNLVKDFLKQGIVGVQKEFLTKEQLEDTENVDEIYNKIYLPVVYVQLKDLNIDPKYQRLINKTFIKKAEVFDPLLVKPLSVFKRPGGDLAIVDGQHTSVLAAVYVAHNEGKFRVPCQIQKHPSHYTPEQCEKAEANYFKRFNSLRNIVSAVAKLRADIAQGAKYALTMEENFKSIEVHVEGIGADDDGTNLVKGYDRLKQAIGKYKVSLVKTAVALYKKHNSSNEDKNKWNHPLNGGMVLGLAATFHFLDNYVGEADKREGFLAYLNSNISKRSIASFIEKTQGPQMDVLILEKILEHYNFCVEQGILNYPTIGMEKKNSLWDQWKNDGIHSKNTVTEEDETEKD